MIHPSTFSIVAFDSQDRCWGVAVASKFPAVGAIVPWAQAGKGAVATQAYANTTFGPNGLDLLGQGFCAEDALASLLAADEDREKRQVGIVDSQGGSATFTGAECMDWAGGINGPGYAIQGNILANQAVIRDMQTSFQETKGKISFRLLTALRAGEKAGGDRRGRQSAALVVVKEKSGYAGFNDRMLDYRIDDDPDPITKLNDLIYLHHLYFEKSPESDQINLRDKQLLEIQSIMNQLGYLKVAPTGIYDASTQEAFLAFTGNENFEERCDPSTGWIDKPVYDYLIGKYTK